MELVLKKVVIIIPMHHFILKTLMVKLLMTINYVVLAMVVKHLTMILFMAIIAMKVGGQHQIISVKILDQKNQKILTNMI